MSITSIIKVFVVLGVNLGCLADAEGEKATMVLVAYPRMREESGSWPPDKLEFINKRQGKVICSISDILAYDKNYHIARITDVGLGRLMDSCKKREVIVFFADGVPCYAAECWGLGQSSGGDFVSIVPLEAKGPNQANIAVKLRREFAKEVHAPDDPRDNKILLRWLDKNRKIVSQKK